MSSIEKKDCLVSVLIPAYNVEKYLDTCLKSVCEQSYTNLEIIIINDGSTDNTLKVIEQHAKQDKRIRYLSRENKGLIPTRLQELELCTGDYIAIVDSDDWIDCDYIEKLLKAAEKYNADIVRCGDVIEFLAEGRKRLYCKNQGNEDLVIERKQFAEEVVPDLCCTAYFNSIHSELVSKSLIENTLLKKIEKRSNVSIGEDLVINCELYKKAEKIVVIPEFLYHYRKNPQSMMAERLPIERFVKRLNDSYITFQAIKEVYELFPGMERDIYDIALTKDLDGCVNLYFESFGNWSDKKMAIKKAQEFIEEKQINRVRVKKLSYLYSDKIKITIISKLIDVTLPYRIKSFVKSILIWINSNKK